MLPAPMSSDQPATNRPPLLLIANPAAGAGRAAAAADRLAAALTGRGLPFIRHDSERRGHAREFAARQLPDQPVVVVGGDGTLHEVLNGLQSRAGKLGPLAVLPSGSGNDFAASLHLCQRPAELALALATDEPREFDVGLAEFAGPRGHESARFANTAGFGFDAEVAAFARRPHRLRGRLLYGAATLAVLRHNPSFLGTLIVDDGPDTPATTWQGELSFVATCNGQFFGGGLHLVPGGRSDDGRLDAVAVAACPRRTLLWLLAKLLCGRHLGDSRLRHHRRRRIQVVSDRPLEGALDGEGLGHRITQITYAIAPERLQVVGTRASLGQCPRAAAASAS
jgi:diacylglycerol kinase (ATP)